MPPVHPSGKPHRLIQNRVSRGPAGRLDLSKRRDVRVRHGANLGAGLGCRLQLCAGGSRRRIGMGAPPAQVQPGLAPGTDLRRPTARAGIVFTRRLFQPVRLPAAPTDRRRHAYARAIYISKTELLGLKNLYLGTSFEAGKVSHRFNGARVGTRLAPSVFGTIDPGAGPFTIGLRVGEGGNQSFYLLFGKP